jgi:hypothetical protein
VKEDVKKKKETTSMDVSSKIGRVQMWDTPSCVSKGVFQNHDEEPYLYLLRF